MVKLYFLEVADPITGFGIRAGFTYNGKRYVSLVTSQFGIDYVKTGARITKDLERHPLSKDQSEAVSAFAASPDFAVEYPAPIL